MTLLSLLSTTGSQNESRRLLINVVTDTNGAYLAAWF